MKSKKKQLRRKKRRIKEESAKPTRSTSAKGERGSWERRSGDAVDRQRYEL